MIHTLTVGELKTYLSNFDEDLPVFSISDYGDRNSTMQAIPVGILQEGLLQVSAYSDSGYKVVGTDEGDSSEDPTVLVLNYEDI